MSCHLSFSPVLGFDRWLFQDTASPLCPLACYWGLATRNPPLLAIYPHSRLGSTMWVAHFAMLCHFVKGKSLSSLHGPRPSSSRQVLLTDVCTDWLYVARMTAYNRLSWKGPTFLHFIRSTQPHSKLLNVTSFVLSTGTLNQWAIGWSRAMLGNLPASLR